MLHSSWLPSKRKNQDLQMRGSLSLPPLPLSLSLGLFLCGSSWCTVHFTQVQFWFTPVTTASQQCPNNVPTMSSHGWPWGAWADECLPDFVKIKRLTRREADGFLLCTSASTNFNESLQNLRAVFFLHRLANSASDVGGKEANFSTNMIGDMGGRALLRVLFTHKIAPGPQV